MAIVFPLQIFYDGSCAVCSAEMESYKRKAPADRLLFVDISAADFNPDLYGKSLKQFMAELHVRDADGQFVTGVDAFIAIWQAFPAGSVWRIMAALAGLPGIHLIGRGGYRLFAQYRHLLPRRQHHCASDPCEGNHRKLPDED